MSELARVKLDDIQFMPKDNDKLYELTVTVPKHCVEKVKIGLYFHNGRELEVVYN